MAKRANPGNTRWAVAVLGLATLLFAFDAAAEHAPDEASDAKAEVVAKAAEIAPVKREVSMLRPVQAAPTRPSFRPPRRGKPSGQIGGGSRGGEEARHPTLVALAPDPVGRTTAAQPSLFWFIDVVLEPDTQLVFTLNDERAIAPLVTLELAPPSQAGVQRIDLGGTAAKLEIGVEYDWSIAIVVDPAHRSKDIVAAGWIERVAPHAAFDSADPVALAEDGVWYDALTHISDMIDGAPHDTALRERRQGMIHAQLGIPLAPSVD